MMYAGITTFCLPLDPATNAKLIHPTYETMPLQLFDISDAYSVLRAFMLDGTPLI